MPLNDHDLSQIRALRKNVESALLGKPEVVRLAVAALLARGHLLIEDIPGVGKTTLARALAKSIACDFRRIQFTPDLLPADVTGVSVWDPEKRAFAFRPGPVFANVVLADEVNRATPRTQSALLEAMNESRVTVDGETRPLPSPFLVIATQNPVEFSGTYALPESQLDRFLMLLRIGYPPPAEERRIVIERRASDPVESLAPAVTAEDVRRLCGRVADVRMAGPLSDYALDIIHRTRDARDLSAGASPRGALHLVRAACALALVDGRDFATPDDVKAVAVPVLAHRVTERRARASSDGRREREEAIGRILRETPVPV